MFLLCKLSTFWKYMIEFKFQWIKRDLQWVQILSNGTNEYRLSELDAAVNIFNFYDLVTHFTV